MGRLYFASNRPIEGSEFNPQLFRIFYMQREGAAWGDPQSVGEAVNQGGSLISPFVAADGTLYFTVQHPDSEGGWKISRSLLVNEVYQAPEPVDDSFDLPATYELFPFIAPDQSYIIFVRNGEPYMSWRQSDGIWSKPESIAFALSLSDVAWNVTVSLDGKVVFISTLIRPVPELPQYPPGFDLVLDRITDAKNLASIKTPDTSPDVYVYWISSEVLPKPDE